MNVDNALGDVNVPSGANNFEGYFGCSGQAAIGRIRLAKTNYVDPYWGLATFKILSPTQSGLSCFVCEITGTQLLSNSMAH